MGCNDGRALCREDIPTWIEVDAQGAVWTRHNLGGYPGPRRRAERRGGCGYRTVLLAAGRVELAHRVVYAWHRGSAPAGVLVLHGNHVRSDNRPENLRLGTNLDNMADMRAAGRSPGRHCEGTKNHNAKLTPELVRAIRTEYSAGETQTALASRFGVRQSTVWSIVKHKTWRHVEAA